MVYWVSKLPTLVMENGQPMYDFGWLNSYHVQIIPFIANAFSIFLFTQYFSTIPTSFDEAARIDGAGWFTIYRRIIVPLAGPAFATVAILTFLPAWNQYLWPLMVVQQEDLRPVMVGMQYFFQINPAWGEVMAYTSLITLPVLVMFLAFQRAFVSSIASSGVKG
jgi:multiple sugar transport system permease protein